jgi:transcriptional regulator with XRE-family HTH domain
MSVFSDRVKRLRNEANLSLRQLSKLTGISPSAIHSYEVGVREAGYQSLEALSDVFNCDIDYLLGKSDIKNSAANAMGYNSLFEAQKLNLQLFGEKLSPEEPKLSEGEKILIELFRQIPEEQQQVFLEMGRVYANSLKKD